MLTPQLTLAELGYRVFQVGANKKPFPFTHGCKDGTTDTATIEGWTEARPNCNWAIATDGLIVVDVDLLDKKTSPRPNAWPHDEDKALELAAAPMVVTPSGGRHYYFKAPAGFVLGNSASTLAEGVDIRATGGYVVVPPSVVDGKAYRWVSGSLDIGPDQLPEPPSWLLATLAEPNKDVRSLPAVGGMMIEGTRNDSLFRNGCAMRRRGMTYDEILAALTVANKKRCNPPLSQSEVESITKSAAEFEPDQEIVAKAEGSDSRRNNAGPAAPVLVKLSDVVPQSVQWLWPSRIALGKLTILAGEPGLGKSFLTMDLAARVSTGNNWPDCPDGFNKAGSVILLSAEDDLADTIRPRLDKAGADVNYISALQGVEYSGDWKAHCFNLERDLPALEQAINATPGCRLIVIDPISAYLGGSDSHNNAEVRALLMPLAELAARSKAAVLGVTHLNKGIGGKALHRITGSIAFVAAARSGWLVDADKQDTAKRLFLPIKNNLAENIGGLAYHIIDGAVVWEAGRVDITADEALAESFTSNGPTVTQDAEDWLREFLAYGPKPKADVDEAAEANMVSPSALRRAKRELGVVSAKRGFGADACWVWSLPDQEHETESEDDLSLAT